MFLCMYMFLKDFLRFLRVLLRFIIVSQGFLCFYACIYMVFLRFLMVSQGFLCFYVCFFKDFLRFLRAFIKVSQGFLKVSIYVWCS